MRTSGTTRRVRKRNNWLSKLGGNAGRFVQDTTNKRVIKPPNIHGRACCCTHVASAPTTALLVYGGLKMTTVDKCFAAKYCSLHACTLVDTFVTLAKCCTQLSFAQGQRRPASQGDQRRHKSVPIDSEHSARRGVNARLHVEHVLAGAEFPYGGSALPLITIEA